MILSRGGADFARAARFAGNRRFLGGFFGGFHRRGFHHGLA